MERDNRTSFIVKVANDCRDLTLLAERARASGNSGGSQEFEPATNGVLQSNCWLFEAADIHARGFSEFSSVTSELFSYQPRVKGSGEVFQKS